LEELIYCFREAFWSFDLRQMAAVRDDPQMAVPKLADRGVRLRNRQHHVIRPPNEQDGDVKPEQLGEHEIALSEGGDLGAQCGQCRVKVIGESSYSPLLGEPGRWREARVAKQQWNSQPRALRRAKACFPKSGRELAVPGEGQRAHGRMHVAAQSRARDEHETSDALRDVHSSLDSGGSTEGVTDHDDRACGAGIEKLSYSEGEARGRRLFRKPLAVPKPGEIRSKHSEVRRECREDPAPTRGGLTKCMQ
jgi:hypothetical protein